MTAGTPPGQGPFTHGVGGATQHNDKDFSAFAFVLSLVFWPWTITLLVAKRIYLALLRFPGRSLVKYKPPPRWLMHVIAWPFRLINPPVVVGGQNLDMLREREGDAPPVILVGNHSLYGVDHIPLMDEVYSRTAVYPRGLYDTVFAYIPVWKQLAELMGGVVGTRKNCEELMAARQCLLLYPGGAREAYKRGAREKYRLMWKDKLGFVRMAIKHGYTIMPFASVGLEDSVCVMCTIDISWWLRWTRDVRKELSLPVPAPYNTMQRQYFAFGEPIVTAKYENDWENDAKCLELYERVRGEVQGMIYQLQNLQKRDPNRYPLRRTGRRILSLLRMLKDPDSTVRAGLLQPAPVVRP